MTTTPDDQSAKPAKKAAAKKTAAKKATASAEDATRTTRSLYLPALPDGFEYTGIAITGANGETISVTPAAGPDVQSGSASLAFEGQGLNRSQTYSDMKSAINGASKAARAMGKIAEREAELSKVREEALSL